MLLDLRSLWEQSTAGLAVPLVTNTQTFFAPVVSLEIDPGLVTNTQTFFGATVSLQLNPGLFTNTQTFYDFTVGDVVVAGDDWLIRTRRRRRS